MTERTRGLRPDYKELHSTGQILLKESRIEQRLEVVRNSPTKSSLTVGTMPTEETHHDEPQKSIYGEEKGHVKSLEDQAVVMQLVSQASALSDDIDDFIDENSIDDAENSLTELDSILSQIEKLRSMFRIKHKELESFMGVIYQDRFGPACEQKLDMVKCYVKNAKKAKKHLRDSEHEGEMAKESRRMEKLQFLSSEIDRTISRLKLVFGEDISPISDDDVTKKKGELNEHLKVMQTIPKTIENMIDSGVMSLEIKGIKKKYEELIDAKLSYTQKLDEELKKREIEKHREFNKSSMNIKLPKFKGYNSSQDIYTFQDAFEKLHMKSTPEILLPDTLINNYLEGPALALVKNIKEIDEIWNRLKDAYGDSRIMLSKKLSEFSNMEQLWKTRDASRTAEGLSKIINLMKDLIQMAKRHGLENRLYYGDSLDRIYKLLGEGRLTRWLQQGCKKEGEEQWLEIITFLDKELQVSQQKFLIYGKTDPPSKDKRPSNYHMNGNSSSSDWRLRNSTPTSVCVICGESDHVQTNGPGGSKLVQYFVCKKFVSMTTMERFQALKAKGYCFQCLFPGADMNQGKHKDGRCQRDFICKQTSHDRFTRKKHVLVCDEHKELKENQELLELYKSKFILKQRQQELPSYAKDIRLSHHVTPIKSRCPTYIKSGCDVNLEKTSSFNADLVDDTISYTNNILDDPKILADSVEESAIYMLQRIQVDQNDFNVFYDTGCGDFVSRVEAIQRIGSRAVQLHKGPVTLGGVGGVSMQSSHGIYGVQLPLADGGDVLLAGVCMEKITETFPTYPLMGRIEEDIRRGYHEKEGNLKNIPLLPPSVGGDTDFMFGIKYSKYFPEKIFQLDSGLAIYKSYFKNVDGSRGVVGGPHEIINMIEQKYQHHTTSFLANQRQLFRFGYQVNPDVPMLGFKDDADDTLVKYEHDGSVSNQFYVPRCVKKFFEAEVAGSEIDYRCIKCRSCRDCKNHDHVAALSIKEEIEQDLINQSVEVNIDNCETVATMPLLSDPSVKLAPNRHKARKIYDQQLKRHAKNPEDKKAIIKSEEKLQQLGFVAWVKDLPEDIQKMLREHPVQNFIPWRVVFKENSTTTPCRIVFDASQPTDSGYSLNDILPKGINMLNRLVEIFIRWRIHLRAFHCDVQKMYNVIQLSETCWCLQRYLFQKDLDSSVPPEEKVIKTLIYGVRSSGNQAQCGLRKTASLFKHKYPEVEMIVSKDTYMDDCLSGGHTEQISSQRQDHLQLVLGFGGFTLKGFTVTGKDPDEALSSDGKSIGVAGLKWFPREDLIALDIKELNFARKRRGKKSSIIKDVSGNLTKRHCASKLGEIFDLTGIVTPLIAGMKMDLHELNVRKLHWDDVLPYNLQQIWNSHFQMMTEIGNLRYQRAIIPEDAIDLHASTLDFGDASKSLVCVAIYVRFKRKNGQYSCQLIFARSRLVPDGMTQPRAELYAALVNAHAGEVVRRALSGMHQRAIKFTDSQIVLYWICKNDQVLRQWPRNRVIEVLRFTEGSSWRYVKSKDMIADIGTRRCSSINVVDQESIWIRGFEWMKKDEVEFPMMTAEEITLSNQEFQNVKTEVQEDVFKPVYLSAAQKGKREDVFSEALMERYQFSRYIIDPNRHRFTDVIRILALVIRFIQRLKHRVMQRKSNSSLGTLQPAMHSELIPNEKEINAAKKYFFQKATLEVKRYLKPGQYKEIAQDVNGILTFTGRILPDDSVSIVGRATQVMKDLTSSTFCVPLVENKSPIAYSIANDVHWYHPSAKHCGVETVLRYVMQHVYIIEGRSVITKIGKNCERCRYLNKKCLQVSMGPVSPHNLNIAPAFYVTQLDIAGPFTAHCHHHKRNTIKVWLLVFCCATTGTAVIKVMEDYSNTAFLQAFSRFSSDVGYPKTILCDEGSQLIKGCESMQLKFQDLQFKLHQIRGIDFEVCPVGGHNMNGRVERKIREIRKSISKALTKDKLSIIQWETLASTISNTINNMPLALGNSKCNIESLDLLTPNRLKMGRNNERSPTGCVTVSHPDKTLKENESIFNSWFEIWLSAHVPKLIDQPKWFKSEEDLKSGDIVLFTKQESPITSTYQYGIVEAIEIGRDKKVRKIKVRYRNHNEKMDRITYRSVRGIVVIRRIDETNIMEELGEVSRMIEEKQFSDDKT